MATKLFYPVTTGRSGTVYATELLRTNLAESEATVYHERVGYPNFGTTTPDASHLTTFNTVGNNPFVAQFWEQKLTRDLADPRDFHIEMSHFLAKGGLIENLSAVSDVAEVHLLFLTRDPFRIAWSFINRFDFANVGFTWLFSLDPGYRNVIVPSAAFREQGMVGHAIWYVAEMFARQGYYERLLAAEQPGIRRHHFALERLVRQDGADELFSALGTPVASAILPPKQNASKQEFFDEAEKVEIRRLFDRLWQDPRSLGEAYYDSGRRLGDPDGTVSQSPRRRKLRITYD